MAIASKDAVVKMQEHFHPLGLRYFPRVLR